MATRVWLLSGVVEWVPSVRRSHQSPECGWEMEMKRLISRKGTRESVASVAASICMAASRQRRCAALYTMFESVRWAGILSFSLLNIASKAGTAEAGGSDLRWKRVILPPRWVWCMVES